jgi:hypothetical protein
LPPEIEKLDPDIIQEPIETPEVTDAPAPDEPAVGEPAAPSAAKGEPDSILDVVRDVVSKGKSEKEAAPPAPSEEEPAPGDEPAKVEGQDDFSDVPFNKHPRFQQLLAKVKTSERDATRYQNVQRFMTENNLDAAETAEGLVIMGLAKTNPPEAWKRIKPFVEKLLLASGEILPDDLSAQVRNGQLTETSAYELNRLRATVDTHAVQQQQAQTRQEQDNQARHVEGLRGAATTWQADRTSKDPNFASKLTPIMKEVAYLQNVKGEGRPDTPEGVKEQLNRAYKAVNASLAPVALPPAAQRRALTPVMGTRAPASSRPAPTSILDIVKNRGA